MISNLPNVSDEALLLQDMVLSALIWPRQVIWLCINLTVYILAIYSQFRLILQLSVATDKVDVRGSPKEVV